MTYKRFLDPAKDYTISAAEIDIQIALHKKGENSFHCQKTFYKLITVADFYFADVNLAVFIDGEQVHKNKELEDEDKRVMIKGSPYRCIVRSYGYKAPITKARLTEIVDAIIDDVVGLRKLKQK